ncbi:MAG TPA: hypothetical protein VKH19_04560 [Gemmatimonadaceae bacterium]|nr:hypothetical protein [Gemmatimonadaceae bacterium]
MTTQTEIRSVAAWRDEAAYSLLYIAGLIASIAFAATSRAIAEAPPELRAPEVWRLWGQLVFSGMCLLLAINPRRHAGLWELALAYSLGVAVVLITATPSAGWELVGAVTSAMLVTASYVLAGGYLAWSPSRGASTVASLSLAPSFMDAAPRIPANRHDARRSA